MAFPLAVNQRFQTATAKVTAPPLPAAFRDQVENTVRAAASQGLRTLVLEVDAKGWDALGCFYACGDCKVFMRELPAFDGAYPEPAVFSRSSCVIAWRKDPADPDQIQVCVVQDSHRPDRFAFVAGGQKRGETSIEGAMREAQEEAGLVLDPATFQWLGTSEMKGPFGEGNTLHTFAAKVLNPEADLLPQASEVASAEWMSVEQALAVITIENARQALRDFMAGKGRPVVTDEYGVVSFRV